MTSFEPSYLSNGRSLIHATLAYGIMSLLAFIGLVTGMPAVAEDWEPAWQKTEWRFHPPAGFPRSEKYKREAFAPLANGWVAVLGQLDSTWDGFIQVHDETGRWVWTQALRGEVDGIVGYWSEPAALAVRSRSGSWDLVAVGNEDYYVWRLDAEGNLLWRRRLDTDLGLELAPAAAADETTVWLGGWAETEDYMCGEGAAVVKLDESGGLIWRWRQPLPIFGAANDLLPLDDGRLLVLVEYGGPRAYLGSMSADCPQSVESELVLLDAEGRELARRKLPFELRLGGMIRLADGRVALLVQGERASEDNRMFIVSIDANANDLSVAEVELDRVLLDLGYFGYLPVVADRGGGLILYVGDAVLRVGSTGQIMRTEKVPPMDWWPCWFHGPSNIVCLEEYLLDRLKLD